MKRDRIVIGIDFEEVDRIRNCKVCFATKLPRQFFLTRINKSSAKLRIIYTDICGPMRTASNGGEQYFMTIIDDYSRSYEVFFLKSKNEASSKIIKYVKFAEKQTGLKVKAIQSDNGTEYCNKTLDSFLEKEDILRRLSTAHIPQQNGVAERKNRTLVESARCMIEEASLLHSFWAEAIATANYIRNRCIFKSLNPI